jgi:hypothetical protein
MNFFKNLRKRRKEDRVFQKKLYLKNAKYKRIVIEKTIFNDSGFYKFFSIVVLCLTLILIVILWLYPYQVITFLKWYLNMKLGFTSIVPQTVLK